MKQSSNYSYDPNGLLKVVKDANGKETHFSYDTRGNVTQVVDSLGNITDYRYNLRGDKVSETRYRSKADGTIEAITTAWDYDLEGRIKTMTDAANRTTTYEYDLQGHQIAVVDALGRRSRSVYNEKGELIATILPDATPENSVDNPRSQSRYDSAGRKIAEIDPLGRETRYVYDKVGRLIETIYADDTVENWRDNPRSGTEYYTDGLVKAQIDERGNRTEFRYDAVGRQIAVIAADSTPHDLSDNPTTRYIYDKAGQQESITDALGHTTRYVYDDLGRMVRTVFQDQTFTTQTYDNLGRRVATTDQNGNRTEYRYDDLGRLTGVKNALLDWTTYAYNEQGQLTAVTDAENQTTRYEYDQLGRRTATILPMQQRSVTEYDLVGNVKAMTDFNGQTITYSYDEQNRLIQKLFQDGTKVTYTYTRNGQRDTISFRNASGTITELYDWDYDVRDRLVRRVDEIDGVARSIGYTYDAVGNRTSVTTASGTTFYEFDERNRLDIVRQNGTIVTDYTYDATNKLISTKLGNGTEEIRQYDVLDRLKYLENRKLDAIGTLAQVISSFSYDLDKVGNRTKITEHSRRTSTYTYDDLYRLTRETIDEIGTADDRTISYAYDRVGNRLWKQETLNGIITGTEYDYDSNDRLLWEKMNGIQTTTYTYDNNGSTRTKVENGVTMTYIWNDDKRLVAATLQDGSGTLKQLQYRYNDDGIRVSSTVDGVKTRYLLDEVQAYPQVLEEYATNGTVQVSYVYGHDLIRQNQGSRTTYYHVDGLGSTMELTDTTGNVVSHSRYDAFGNTIAQTGSVRNSYLYTSERYDSNLEDYYLRQRYYDTRSGRFSRLDDYEGYLVEPLTLHKYTYSHNNPANLTDPTGRMVSTLEMNVFLTVLTILAAGWVTYSALQLINHANDSADIVSWRFLNEIKDKLIEGAQEKPREKAKKSEKSKEFEKDGDWDGANQDFDNVVAEHGGKVKINDSDKGKRTAIFPDGTSVNIRPDSTDGAPTIQIDNMPGQGRKHIKLRYRP